MGGWDVHRGGQAAVVRPLGVTRGKGVAAGLMARFSKTGAQNATPTEANVVATVGWRTSAGAPTEPKLPSGPPPDVPTEVSPEAYAVNDDSMAVHSVDVDDVISMS